MDTRRGAVSSLVCKTTFAVPQLTSMTWPARPCCSPSMTSTRCPTLIVSWAKRNATELKNGKCDMNWAERKVLMSRGVSEMATLAGGRCLRMRPALYVSRFSSYSSSEIFRIFSPHTALAWYAHHIRGSGCVGLLRLGVELVGLSGIQGRKATISLASEDLSCSQTRPMSPRYNPW